MKGNTILTSDRIGVLAYIMTFFFSWSGKLSKLGSPEEWKNRIQKSIRELSEKSGVEIKSIRLKDAFRFELDKDFALKEDKILAIFKGYEYWKVLDTKDPELKNTIKRQVLTYYIIVWDSMYGLVSFRICTWVPCMTYVYFNGHDALKCYFEQNGIDYSGYKNSIVDLDKETRKEVKKQINRMLQLSKLSNVARKWFPVFGMGELVPFYKFSFNVLEFDVDQYIGNSELVKLGIRNWSMANFSIFENTRIFSVLDEQRIFLQKKGNEFVPKMIDNQRHVMLTYSFRGIQFKVYPKDQQIRFEITYNNTFLKTQSKRKDFKGLKSNFSMIYDLAQRMMSRIFSITKKIKVEKSYEFTDKIPVIKEVDIKFLKAANQIVVGEFKNSDIREITGLNANQVYYRLNKFKGYFSHHGKFWEITAMGLKLIILKIEQIGDYLGTFNFFAKDWKGVEVGVDPSVIDI